MSPKSFPRTRVFDRFEAKDIIREINKTYKHEGFRLTSFIPADQVGAPGSHLEHFAEDVAGIRHLDLKGCHEAFRRIYPNGEYFLVIVAGEDEPGYPDRALFFPVWYVLFVHAMIYGLLKDEKKSTPLFLDTHWLDKGFGYIRRPVYKENGL